MAVLSAHLREAGLVTIATLNGRIDLGEGSAIFRTTIRGLIAANRLRIILDLKGVSAVDSAGIGELIGAYVPLKTKGGVLKLLNPTKNVHVVLQITNLSKVFDLYFDEAAALNSFQ
jgi:anti-sigma B factor antagonist